VTNGHFRIQKDAEVNYFPALVSETRQCWHGFLDYTAGIPTNRGRVILVFPTRWIPLAIRRLPPTRPRRSIGHVGILILGLCSEGQLKKQSSSLCRTEDVPTFFVAYMLPRVGELSGGAACCRDVGSLGGQAPDDRGADSAAARVGVDAMVLPSVCVRRTGRSEVWTPISQILLLI
jgi:hypothetical protein